MRIYGSEKSYEYPHLDLLSLIFDSSECLASNTTVVHTEAAQPSNFLTKQDAHQYTELMAYQLRHKYNIGTSGNQDDVVLCISSGQILLPIIFFAVIAAGGIFSPASTAFNEQELARQIRQSGTRLIVTSPDCEHTATAAALICRLSKRNILVLNCFQGNRSLKTCFGEDNILDSRGNGDVLQWEVISEPKTLRDRVACLVYSSGTIGAPKGAKISHANLVFAALAARYLQDKYLHRQKARDPNFLFQLRTIAHLPVAHIAGLQGYIINPIICGGGVFWMPKYNFHDFLICNERFRITYFFSVPPIYVQIAKSPKVTTHFDSLIHAISGAAPLGQELTSQAESKLGCHIAQTWGLTETTGTITFMPWDQHDTTGSISPLMPNTKLRIVDDDEVDVEEGQRGELLVQGPQIIPGYWQNSQATNDLFTGDGKWLKTGDVGVWKDNKFYIVDRKKFCRKDSARLVLTVCQELIKYKGLQVAPAEIEGILLQLPYIVDAAVIGVLDVDGSGNELPRAYIVADQVMVSGKDIKDFVASQLSQHKQLRGGVIFVDSFPKNTSGKILRNQLRALARTSKL